MIDFIKKMMKKYSELIRYGIFGVLTVIVNTVLYLSLSLITDDLIANSIAFVLSVLFAYWTNCRFVFRDKITPKNFIQFFGMRIGTILIDDGGMWLLLWWNWDKLLAKCIVNIIIIILNYIFSKFLIFAKKKDKPRKEDEA